MAPKRCPVCNGDTFRRMNVLWPELVHQWQLAPDEVDYVNRQQGEACAACGSNLRSLVLADALRVAFRTNQPLIQFLATPAVASFKILELNEAGTLHPMLQRMPGHVFGAYPDVDMNALPFEEASFDIVIHSDTLEHVPNPVHALSECRRVLRPGGMLCYTVPIIVGRMSRSRDGLPKSFHGNANINPEDYLVRTEYGADAWTQTIRAGFSDVHLFTREFPAAIAIAAVKTL